MLTIALLLGFAGLVVRLVDLQVLRHEELSQRASRNTRQQIVHEPRRGDILDRNGSPLATCLTVKTVCADPVLIGTHETVVARAVAPVLGLDVDSVADRLQLRTRQTEDGRTITNRYVVLRRKVTMEQWAQVKAVMAGLDFGVDEARLKPTSDSSGICVVGRCLPTLWRISCACIPTSVWQRARFGLRGPG